MSRNEVDARQHRCDQARLRLHPANVPNVAPLGEDGLKLLGDLVGPVVDPQLRLLSFAEAQLAGEAMFERAHLMAPELRLGLVKEDSGWADMFRAGWDAVQASRRRETHGEDHQG